MNECQMALQEKIRKWRALWKNCGLRKGWPGFRLAIHLTFGVNYWGLSFFLTGQLPQVFFVLKLPQAEKLLKKDPEILMTFDKLRVLSYSL